MPEINYKLDLRSDRIDFHMLNFNLTEEMVQSLVLFGSDIFQNFDSVIIFYAYIKPTSNEGFHEIHSFSV